ncbi:hypothetical protein ACQP3L_32430, partial [Escherichia coli]
MVYKDFQDIQDCYREILSPKQTNKQTESLVSTVTVFSSEAVIVPGMKTGMWPPTVLLGEEGAGADCWFP